MPDHIVERCIGVVIGELLHAVRKADPSTRSGVLIHQLMTAEPVDLDRSLKDFGVDSLTWMSVLAALEAKYSILFPDAVLTRPESYTVGGLAHALSECLLGDSDHANPDLPTIEQRSNG